MLRCQSSRQDAALHSKVRIEGFKLSKVSSQFRHEAFREHL